VFNLQKKVLGPDHPDTLGSLGWLAMAVERQWRVVEAKDLRQFEFTSKKKLLGPEHPDTLISMHYLAEALRSLCHFDDALSLMRDCCELRRLLWAPTIPRQSTPLILLTVGKRKFVKG
jgi:hypothetical protein